MKLDREKLARERQRRQVSRFDQKYDVSRIAEVLAAKRTAMLERYGEYAAAAAQVSRVVCDLCDNAGVVCMMRMWYQTYSREIHKLWRNHHDMDITGELGVLRYKWSVRGLDPLVLEKVEAAVLAELRRQDGESGPAAGKPE